MQFQFIRLVLRLLLQTTGARCKLVLLLQHFRTSACRHVTRWRYIIDQLIQLLQLISGHEQFVRVRGNVVAVTSARLPVVFVAGLVLFRIEDRVLEVVQNVWVFGLDRLAKPLSFRSFGLRVVLPEILLLLATSGGEVIRVF